MISSSTIDLLFRPSSYYLKIHGNRVFKDDEKCLKTNGSIVGLLESAQIYLS